MLNTTGGNQNLDPETARNVTLGFVYQPLRDLSVGLDFWWIKISNQIAEFPESAVLANPDLYADRIIRAADGSIDHIVTGLANLGKVKTNGVDVSIDYRFPMTSFGAFGLGLQGTYVDRWSIAIPAATATNSLTMATSAWRPTWFGTCRRAIPSTRPWTSTSV